MSLFISASQNPERRYLLNNWYFCYYKLHSKDLISVFLGRFSSKLNQTVTIDS